MKYFFLYVLPFFFLNCDQKKSEQDKNSQQNTAETPIDVSSDTINDDEVYRLNGAIDVEELNKDIDLTMAIDSLTLNELRVLRNSFAAKQGYCFTNGYLRHQFEQTTWYWDLLEYRYGYHEDGEEPKPITYTPEETAFIEKLKQREALLLQQNFSSDTDKKVHPNLSNVINLEQIVGPSEEFLSRIAQHGFVIERNNYKQLFHVYEENDYKDFPSFITTDLHLQLYHMFFGYLLRTTEQEVFRKKMMSFCLEMSNAMEKIQVDNDDEEIKSIAVHNQVFYAIGYTLLGGTTLNFSDPQAQQWYTQEIQKCRAHKNETSPFLGYTQEKFLYELFLPRGHYTRTKELTQYFEGMMWLQTATFCLSSDAALKRVILQAHVLEKNSELKKAYTSIAEPIRYLIGEEDNLGISDVFSKISDDQTLDGILKNPTYLNQVRSHLETVVKSKDKIKPKTILGCQHKINFLPQRFLPDNLVLLEMVDYKTDPSKRPVPQGLDVFNAFTSKAAHRMLSQDKEVQQWSDYTTQMTTMQQMMDTIVPDATLYNQWLTTLASMEDKDTSYTYPYFMENETWSIKNLNAMLASWAELKHDTLLYAEQPMGAECGSGGLDLPPPVIVGYVEPNLIYWNNALQLIEATESLYDTYELLTPEMKAVIKSIKEKTLFLRNITVKELKKEPLTNEEFGQIELLGSAFEWMTLDMVKKKGEYLDSWENVEGPEQNVAVIADVYTANALNNPKHCVLSVGTGDVDVIYAIVEINGMLHVTKGAVLSYREFCDDMKRYTDEEWQKLLEEKNPEYGVPDWMSPILLDSNTPPVENDERTFYSSGC